MIVLGGVGKGSWTESVRDGFEPRDGRSRIMELFLETNAFWNLGTNNALGF